MRDYQTKSNVGALPDSNSATKYGGGEVTSLRTEAKNMVSRAGLTLAPQDGTGEDTTQQAQAAMVNGLGASSFQVAGTANALVLTPVTGSSGLLLPPDYTTLDGMHISGFAAFTNTAATTFSIGQTVGAQFGVKKILDEAGADLVGGEMVAGSRFDMVFDQSADGGSGAAILRPAAAAGGVLVQSVNFQTGEVASGTTIIAADDTIPQNTEGNEFLTLAITPKDAANILIIEAILQLSHTSGNTITISSLFQDSIADALAVSSQQVSNNSVDLAMPLRHRMVAGTTSPTTFKIRSGSLAAGTQTLNGDSGVRTFGGAFSSIITIWEFKP